MDVRRHNREWVVRWMTRMARGAVLSSDAPPGELCVRCDDAGVWITVRDLDPMPEVGAIYTCGRCGTRTAYAQLHVTARSIGD